MAACGPRVCPRVRGSSSLGFGPSRFKEGQLALPAGRRISPQTRAPKRIRPQLLKRHRWRIARIFRAAELPKHESTKHESSKHESAEQDERQNTKQEVRKEEAKARAAWQPGSSAARVRGDATELLHPRYRPLRGGTVLLSMAVLPGLGGDRKRLQHSRSGRKRGQRRLA